MRSIGWPLGGDVTLVLYGIAGFTVVTWIWAMARGIAGLPLLPDRRRIVPWAGREVVAVAMTWALVCVVIPGYAIDSPAVKAWTAGQPDVRATIGQAIGVVSNLVFVFLAAIVVHRGTGATLLDAGIDRRTAGASILTGILAWPLIAPPVFLIHYLATLVWDSTPHATETWLNGNPSPANWLLASLAAIVVAPLVEEFCFRGMLLGALDREAQLHPGTALGDPAAGRAVSNRRFLANVTVSLGFAALHLAAWPSPIPLFFLSLGLGHLYQRTGSFLPPIALHATFNGITMLLFLLRRTAGV